jgi:hypothetical protein
MRNYSDWDHFPFIISTRTIDLQPKFFLKYKATSSLEVADNFPGEKDFCFPPRGSYSHFPFCLIWSWRLGAFPLVSLINRGFSTFYQSNIKGPAFYCPARNLLGWLKWDQRKRAGKLSATCKELEAILYTWEKNLGCKSIVLVEIIKGKRSPSSASSSE